MCRTISTTLRSKGQIMLMVTSSGIASFLLPDGKTIHSRFGILLNINEDSICNIKQRSALAELLRKTKLKIWHEASMSQKYYFEAFDTTLRDVLRFSNLSSLEQSFDCKVVVFRGNFG